ncbi:MAG: AlpA family phage regulatory protein [Nitrosospira multiformis]|nr:AlpA family phage regulatory protein [Nitrosospira multiformis]
MKLIKLTPVLGLTAKSRTAHYSDIKNGLMTPPVQLGVNSVAWPEHEIIAINAARIAGKNHDEVRQLVSHLIAERKNCVASLNIKGMQQ